MTSRRNFIKKSFVAGSAASLVPSFLTASEYANPDQKKLIVIQLSGGNDGLNTIVPHGLDEYYRSRPTLSVSPKETLKVTDSLGINNKMKSFYELLNAGNVTILNNVGYPNPDRSHFRSMDIWHSANPMAYEQTGWIGRYLDANCDLPHHAIQVDKNLELVMKGNNLKGLAMTNPKQLTKMIQTTLIQQVSNNNHDSGNFGLSYMYKTLIDTKNSIEYLLEMYQKNVIHYDYPQNDFANRLKTIAKLIGSGLDTQIYYASLGGFDTHVHQKNQHNRLLNVYSESISSFVGHLKKLNVFKDVVILTFSEFGRRIDENASGGTDHGKANNVFVIGDNLSNPGFYNENPDLINSSEGDLSFTLDFRSIYQALISQHLMKDSKMILSGNFENIQLLA